jgi:hypothetical protein
MTPPRLATYDGLRKGVGRQKREYHERRRKVPERHLNGVYAGDTGECGLLQQPAVDHHPRETPVLAPEERMIVSEGLGVQEVPGVRQVCPNVLFGRVYFRCGGVCQSTCEDEKGDPRPVDTEYSIPGLGRGGRTFLRRSLERDDCQDEHGRGEDCPAEEQVLVRATVQHEQGMPGRPKTPTLMTNAAGIRAAPRSPLSRIRADVQLLGL